MDENILKDLRKLSIEWNRIVRALIVCEKAWRACEEILSKGAKPLEYFEGNAARFLSSNYRAEFLEMMERLLGFSAAEGGLEGFFQKIPEENSKGSNDEQKETGKKGD